MSCFSDRLKLAATLLYLSAASPSFLPSAQWWIIMLCWSWLLVFISPTFFQFSLPPILSSYLSYNIINPP
ncbi:MAG: hypothetical protein JOS17DRAFT_738527 [Linnemannia elongata]|nr:MAG: hypothetical protein JOS17DRAFT_738527 [Linnemannia elongata]